MAMKLTFTLVNLEDHTDIGVVQSRSRLRLALEAGESLCVPGNFIEQEFAGNEAVQPQVFGFVDDTHPPAEFFHNAIVGDRPVNHQWRTGYLCHLKLGSDTREVNHSKRVDDLGEAQLMAKHGTLSHLSLLRSRRQSAQR
jgi:hypothetical protein